MRVNSSRAGERSTFISTMGDAPDIDLDLEFHGVAALQRRQHDFLVRRQGHGIETVWRLPKRFQGLDGFLVQVVVID